MSMTLAQAQALFAAYLAAETEILQKGQSYSIGNRALTLADLRWVRLLTGLSGRAGLPRRANQSDL